MLGIANIVYAEMILKSRVNERNKELERKRARQRKTDEEPSSAMCMFMSVCSGGTNSQLHVIIINNLLNQL